MIFCIYSVQIILYVQKKIIKFRKLTSYLKIYAHIRLVSQTRLHMCVHIHICMYIMFVSVHMYVCRSNTKLVSKSGTFAACGIVVGVAATLLQKFPDYTPYQIRDQLIQESTKDVINFHTRNGQNLFFNNSRNNTK